MAVPIEANVIQLELTPPLARKIIGDLAADSNKVFFTAHAERRMRERRITRSQVMRCLKYGRITEGPGRDANGSWRLRMEVFSSGEPIAVAAALENDGNGNYIVVITAYCL